MIKADKDSKTVIIILFYHCNCYYNYSPYIQLIREKVKHVTQRHGNWPRCEDNSVEKGKSFQQIVLEQLISVWELGRPNFNSYCKSYSKFGSKLIIDLNVKPEAIKFLEENTGVNLYGLGKDFLNIIQKHNS